MNYNYISDRRKHMFHHNFESWKELSLPQRILRILGFAIGGIFIAIVVALVFSVFVFYLWNTLMPDLFGLPHISLLQAFLLIVLTKLLIGMGHGGFHHHHDGHHHFRGRRGLHHMFHDRNMDWRLYAEYWDTKGKSDFEAWVKERNS